MENGGRELSREHSQGGPAGAEDWRSGDWRWNGVTMTVRTEPAHLPPPETGSRRLFVLLVVKIVDSAPSI